jgi:cell fate regulator YaaT (PSP1 superfamily)
MAEFGTSTQLTGAWAPPSTIEEARARARERFKSRLESGETIGACACGDEDAVRGIDDGSPTECVVGVRFRDSGRVYYFRGPREPFDVGDWIVVNTVRGMEAGQVVIAQHQVRRTLLQGDLGEVLRRLSDDDVARMESRRRSNAEAIRVFGERARARRLGIKPISAYYTFDGAAINFNYSVPDREGAPDSKELQDLAVDLAEVLGCRIELRQVGPRDEARLLGGLGRCGRTLCCSSWLPVFPEISMSMAKNQDLPLNPSKVSGVCGRLLCCLSYENDQYRQMKAVMPKLGQSIETPGGSGTVISLHLLKELVTVRLEDDNNEVTFRCDELGLGLPRVSASAVANGGASIGLPEIDQQQPVSDDPPAILIEESSSGKRRRRRRSGRRGAPSS